MAFDQAALVKCQTEVEKQSQYKCHSYVKNISAKTGHSPKCKMSQRQT